MNILITGGSGFIGTALTCSLLADGHDVCVLTRKAQPRGLPQGARAVQWDGQSSAGWLEIFAGMDAVVNLAGENVGKFPWSVAQKKRILDSRVRAGRAVTEAYQKSSQKPPVLVQASGIGYYGPLGAERIAESAPAGSDFMAGVAREWEDSTAAVEQIPGVRRVVIRTSLVLDGAEGVLPLMALPVRLFAGGPLGSGRQGVSWIHIDDEVSAIRFLIAHEEAAGVFNLSAPEPLSNAEFIRALAKALRRPYWLPAPAFALKLALGDMSTLLLDGQFAMPERLLGLGFRFGYADARSAFSAIYTR